MIDFLNAGRAETLKDFPSGVVSVPLEIKDPPVVEAKGSPVIGRMKKKLVPLKN